MILFKVIVKDLHNLTQIRFLVLVHPFSPTQCLVVAKVLKKQHTKYLFLHLDFVLTFYPVSILILTVLHLLICSSRAFPILKFRHISYLLQSRRFNLLWTDQSAMISLSIQFPLNITVLVVILSHFAIYCKVKFFREAASEAVYKQWIIFLVKINDNEYRILNSILLKWYWHTIIVNWYDLGKRRHWRRIQILKIKMS